jgi:hypothetical protein
MNIDCTLPFAGAQTELVISEPAGKILLDTVVASTTAPPRRNPQNQRPFPFTTLAGAGTLYGIPDTNDLTTIISYSNPLGSIGQGLDFEYAPFPVEKYQMTYLATDNNNDVLIYYAYTDTLQKTLPLFQPSDYSISNAQADNFSVTFPGSRPSYYQLAFFDSALAYTIWVSPDSATTHPITLLTNQKCKLLQNAPPGKFRPHRFHHDQFRWLQLRELFPIHYQPGSDQSETNPIYILPYQGLLMRYPN